MPDITLANGNGGYLIDGATFKFNSRTGGSSGKSTGYIRLYLSLSDLDLIAHTVKITADWSWHTTWSSKAEAWDHNSGEAYQYFKLYTTGTSSSSGTSKTYYLYTGYNKKSYGTPYTATSYYNWSAADHCGNASTYYDINQSCNSTAITKSLTNVTTVDLASDNSLSMSIACSLSGTNNTYGPIAGTQSLGTYTLTIKPDGAIMRINIDGTWKEGLVWINNNGVWTRGTGMYVNNNGTWKRNA